MLNFCSDPKLLLFKTGTIHRTIAPVQTCTRALGLAAGDEPLRAGGAPGTMRQLGGRGAKEVRHGAGSGPAARATTALKGRD